MAEKKPPKSSYDRSLEIPLKIGYTLFAMEVVNFLYWIATNIAVQVLMPEKWFEIVISGGMHFIGIAVGLLGALTEISDVISTPEQDRIQSARGSFWAIGFIFAFAADALIVSGTARTRTGETAETLILVSACVSLVMSSLALTWGVTTVLLMYVWGFKAKWDLRSSRKKGQAYQPLPMFESRGAREKANS
jgi:hypothetical protein